MIPEQRKDYMKKYNARHYAAHQLELKEKAKSRVKAKYQSDPEHRAKKIEYQKQLNAKKADEIREYQRKYKEDNRDRLNGLAAAKKRHRYATDPIYREKCKQGQIEDWKKPEYRAKSYARRAERKKTDVNFMLIESMRGGIRRALRGIDKSAKTIELLGCPIEQLRVHLESQFQEGMTWDNYGYDGWQIDHRRPCSSYNFTDPAQQRECFNWQNLQPLWRKDNQSKGGKWEPADSLKEAIPSFPIKAPTDDKADTSHIQLCSSDAMALWKHGVWDSRTDCPEKKMIYVDRSFSGIAASNRFHWQARMACDSANSPSPSRSWFTPEKHAKLEENMFYDSNPQLVLSASRYISPQFRPSAARAIMEAFNAAKVYDPCGGWGDRLEGAMACACVTHYHCRDVNPLVFPAYAAQKARYDKTNKISMEMVPAEAGGLDGMNFDLVFTSPPYYKLEKYQGDMQSHREYKGFDAWMAGFLFPMLACSWAALREGGHMAINIADVYADHKVNRICGPMAEWAVNNLPGCHYLGAAGYRLAVRMNQAGRKGIVRAEPIMVFSKGPSDWMDRMLAKLTPAPVPIIGEAAAAIPA